MGMEWIDEIGALNGESSCGVLFFDWCVERIKKENNTKKTSFWYSQGFVCVDKLNFTFFFFFR